MGTKTLWIWAAVIVGIAVIAVGWNLFAPKASTEVDQPLEPGAPGATAPPGDPGAMAGQGNGTTTDQDDDGSGAHPTPLQAGTFQGADRYHDVSGTVTLYELSDGSHVLRFEDYEATGGPDVYIYLTPGDPASSDVEGDGVRLLVPGGAEDGQATLRGDFNVPLPDHLDPDDWSGVAVWCEDFNVLFGGAGLVPTA